MILNRPYFLQSQDLPRLRSYWKLVDPIAGKQPPFWGIAVQRFCDAADRVRADEALIDYWIACESLFGEDADVGELTYRLSLKIAHFLGTDSIERERVRSAAREAYRARGLLLHGARHIDQSKLTACVSTMDDITRKSICRCLESRFKSRGDMIRGIEGSIDGGLASQ